MSNASSSATHSQPPVSNHHGVIVDADGNTIKAGLVLTWLDGRDRHAIPGYIDPTKPEGVLRYWFENDREPTTVDTAAGQRITITLKETP